MPCSSIGICLYQGFIKLMRKFIDKTYILLVFQRCPLTFFFAYLPRCLIAKKRSSTLLGHCYSAITSNNGKIYIKPLIFQLSLPFCCKCDISMPCDIVIFECGTPQFKLALLIIRYNQNAIKRGIFQMLIFNKQREKKTDLISAVLMSLVCYKLLFSD